MAESETGYGRSSLEDIFNRTLFADVFYKLTWGLDISRIVLVVSHGELVYTSNAFFYHVVNGFPQALGFTICTTNNIELFRKTELSKWVKIIQINSFIAHITPLAVINLMNAHGMIYYTPYAPGYQDFNGPYGYQY
ncbi:uncharacterized protein LOC119687091 [Teleopsis dalmanni]|uniref:uncharacterized protein LOC119687091 n=1 Tax=Teleopsis dalmanni TaxID=139649 RepID=UPI0018CC97A4|nr:uncharacterized protein LOC119687091 [Teleopsis dalmanni]